MYVAITLIEGVDMIRHPSIRIHTFFCCPANDMATEHVERLDFGQSDIELSCVEILASLLGLFFDKKIKLRF